MIKWIIFDQARVQTYDVFSTVETCSINGKEFSAKELEEIFYLENYSKYMLGHISEEELIQEFIETKEFEITTDEYRELFKQGIEEIKGTREIIEKLKEKYQIAALINEGVEWTNYKLDVPDFRKYFEKVIISGEVKMRKPDEGIYIKTLEILNAMPEECLFIDDQEKNCVAAEKIGIKSIIFNNPEQLEEELKKLKIF